MSHQSSLQFTSYDSLNTAERERADWLVSSRLAGEACWRAEDVDCEALIGFARRLSLLRESGDLEVRGSVSGGIRYWEGTISESWTEDSAGDEAVLALLTQPKASYAFRQRISPDGETLGADGVQPLFAALLGYLHFQSPFDEFFLE